MTADKLTINGAAYHWPDHPLVVVCITATRRSTTR